ncbi:MAG: Ribosomal RNA small subunit methyltransferase C [Planctomycetes bacterium]|nr:Ribosomal RNA small subunit methyltransferase C [Planctomycetota bacterium]
MRTFLLGGPGANPQVTDALRKETVAFRSPRGVALAQRLLIEAMPKKPVASILTGLDTEGAVALAAREVHPGAAVRWFGLDAYVARKVQSVFDMNAAEGAPALLAEAREDLPEGPFDLILLPFPSSGESDLMWDVLESAHDALAPGGRLVASTNGDGRALRKAIEHVFGKVTPWTPTDRGAVAYGVRTKKGSARSPRAHVVDAAVPFAGADGDAAAPIALSIETRPGTFCHGSLDKGTRALLQWWKPEGEKTLLDLGAGCGWIGIFAAKADPSLRVTMVESNARAVGCALRNVERNGLAEPGRVTTLLRADLEGIPVPAGGFDAVLTNPPYFSDFRIARSFCSQARHVLRPGGRFAMVVRNGAVADAHTEVMSEVFGSGRSWLCGAYVVLAAVR